VNLAAELPLREPRRGRGLLRDAALSVGVRRRGVPFCNG
jgi:hypothetical protein